MALAVAQHAKAIWGSGTPPGATFSAAPSNGNLLVAFVSWYIGNAVLTAGSGWTQLYTDATGTSGTMNRAAVFYKYAGASESATQTPSTTSTNAGCIEIFEISGVAGVWATDFQEEWHGLAKVASPSVTTTAHNTAAANQLVLGMTCGEINWTSGSQTAAPTNSAGGQTDVDGQFNDTGTTSHQASIAYSKAVATSGTNVQVTTTFHGNQEAATFQFVSLNSGATAETGTAVLAFAGIAIVGSAASQDSGSGEMDFAGIAIVASGIAEHVGTGELDFLGISMLAYGADLGVVLVPPNPAADATLKDVIQPLTHNVPVTESKTGNPTPELQRKWDRMRAWVSKQQTLNDEAVTKDYVDQYGLSILYAAQLYANTHGGGTGTTWYTGHGVPSAGIGVNGDFYLDVDTGDVYEKESGSWL